MKLVNSILISGYYGFDNSGDDAILKAMIKDLREHDKDVEIIVLSSDPKKTEKMYSVSAIDRFSFKQVIKGILWCDLFISGGGSLLQDITSTRSLLYYLVLMRLAKIFKKPVMVYANGIGPIDRPINRLITKSTLNKVDLITLRDKDSEKFIKELGVKNENITITADPVFTLDSSPQDIIDKIFESEGIPRDKKMIAISLRPWKNTDKLIDIIAGVIEKISTRYDVNVVLIPMHYPEDLKVSQKVRNKLGAKSCYVIKNKYSVEEIMGIIKEMELIIAMRLHSLIYAARQEIPMLGLVYDPKIEGILRSIDMNYMLDVDSLKHDELIDNIDMVWENRELLKETLKKFDKELQEKALENISLAFNLLK